MGIRKGRARHGAAWSLMARVAAIPGVELGGARHISGEDRQ